jgi:two-component sensor histidine kinase
MAIEHLPHSTDQLTNIIFEGGKCHTLESCNRRLKVHRRREARLREALAHGKALLDQKNEFIQNQVLMTKESEHRLLNDLQVIASLLSLQSRSATNAEVGSQLAAAADRIATIARIHRRLHLCDGVQSVAFKQFLDDLCGDFSTMLSSEQNPDGAIVVEAIEIKLPASTAIPLGFIVNELITNAAKYGKGRIAVRLELNGRGGYALSVSNDGPSLPVGFDPGSGKGLGMQIVRSFVERIHGSLRIERGDNNRGARFTVQFS